MSENVAFPQGDESNISIYAFLWQTALHICVFHISSIKCVLSGQVLCDPTFPEQWAAQAFYLSNTFKIKGCMHMFNDMNQYHVMKHLKKRNGIIFRQQDVKALVAPEAPQRFPSKCSLFVIRTVTAGSSQGQPQSDLLRVVWASTKSCLEIKRAMFSSQTTSELKSVLPPQPQTSSSFSNFSHNWCCLQSFKSFMTYFT